PRVADPVGAKHDAPALFGPQDGIVSPDGLLKRGDELTLLDRRDDREPHLGDHAHERRRDQRHLSWGRPYERGLRRHGSCLLRWTWARRHPCPNHSAPGATCEEDCEVTSAVPAPALARTAPRSLEAAAPGGASAPSSPACVAQASWPARSGETRWGG